MTEKLCKLIDQLLRLCTNKHFLEKRDHIYVRNQLLALFKEDSYISSSSSTSNEDFYETLDALCDLAIEKGLIADTSSQRDIFSSRIMALFLPLPSGVESRFWQLYHTFPKLATDYFYQLSQASNYIKMNRIKRNISFHAPSPYGELDITINLSKPEKDPKDIAAKRDTISTSYPTCLLCIENEGYLGRSDHPDRSNHRMISLRLNDKDWMLQYSPYLYYNEHCILLSAQHEPMSLTKETFKNLIAFVTAFPHYFIGSNADLPIVGGSILAHEHYQGGCYTFPLHRAKAIKTFKMPDFKEVSCRILHWPLATISLRSTQVDQLIACAHTIYEAWKTYSDIDADIICETNGVRHNTVTPIARKEGNDFIIDIVLRNNRTTNQYPLGIFHPHEASWHIKKENIGLIEVMGLAILPARLKSELEAVKGYILNTTDTVPVPHLSWAKALKKDYDGSDIEKYIQDALAQKFTTILEDAGVFKMTPEGIKHFERFIAQLQ